MKATPILIILLIASLSYNVYQHFKCKEVAYSVASHSITATDSPGCEKMPPFAAALTIDEVPARKYFDEFTATLKDPDITSGGIISTAAFEEMMCTEKCNGIAYSFARDKDGTTGPSGNGIFLLLEAVNVEYDPSTNSIISVNPIPGTPKYRSGNWCPVNCMAWE